jgi:hypothetical protein
MANRIVPFYTIVNDYDQAGEDALVTSLEGQALGALIIFNTTLGKTRIWNGLAFMNAPMLNPDGGSWNGASTPIGYAINVQALTSSPADGQTVFFGSLPKVPVTAAATSRIYIRKAGTIKHIEIYCYSGTAGTAEAWSLYLRKNNSADTLISTVSTSSNERLFTNKNLNISVADGDYVEIKAVNPTWQTNPLTTIFGGYIYIE